MVSGHVVFWVSPAKLLFNLQFPWSLGFLEIDSTCWRGMQSTCIIQNLGPGAALSYPGIVYIVWTYTYLFVVGTCPLSGLTPLFGVDQIYKATGTYGERGMFPMPLGL